GGFGITAWTKQLAELVRTTARILGAMLDADRHEFMGCLADKLGNVTNEGNNKERWALIHSLRGFGGGGGKKNKALKTALPFRIDPEGNVLATRQDIAKDVAVHFSELECAERMSQHDYVKTYGSGLATTKHGKVDPANVITLRETEVLLSKLDTDKAASPDKIFNE
ncbi:unnamed protein product, partial [Prorocentrum cordatum]